LHPPATRPIFGRHFLSRKKPTLSAGHLPAPHPGRLSWSGEPPDPLARPELYDGVVWRRAFGYVGDLAILVILSVVVWTALTFAGILSFGLLMPLVPAALAILPLAYHGLLVGGRRSSTWGMRLFGVEVRSWTGQRPTFLQALVMAVLFYVTVGLTGALILLVVLFNARRRTVHDFLSGTVVVRGPAAAPALGGGRR
jgi:uncharacterized RDD family membrane protein YckC